MVVKKLSANQGGKVNIAVIIIGLAIAVAGIIFLAWYIRGEKKSDNPASQNVQQQSALVLDQSKIPPGWYEGIDEANVVVLDNGAVDTDPNMLCSVEVQRIDDPSVNSSQQQSLTQSKIQENLKRSAEDKGYTNSALPNRTLSYLTTGGIQTVEAQGYKLIAPGGETEANRNQYTAYIVRDGFYVSLIESCSGTDFSEADKALLAISIKL